MYRDLNDYEILYLIKENDEIDYNIIYEKYKPLINKIIMKYASTAKLYSLEIDDLWQVASIMLFKATKGFSQYHNNLFYTYLNKAIEYGIITEIRKNNTKKMNVLNNSISYDQTVPTTGISYIDLIPDPQSKRSFYDKMISYYDLIIFKNTLSFEDSCIFELIYNGYQRREISILLELDCATVKEKINNIKEKLIYI